MRARVPPFALGYGQASACNLARSGAASGQRRSSLLATLGYGRLHICAACLRTTADPEAGLFELPEHIDLKLSWWLHCHDLHPPICIVYLLGYALLAWEIAVGAFFALLDFIFVCCDQVYWWCLEPWDQREAYIELANAAVGHLEYL